MIKITRGLANKEGLHGAMWKSGLQGRVKSAELAGFSPVVVLP